MMRKKSDKKLKKIKKVTFHRRFVFQVCNWEGIYVIPPSTHSQSIHHRVRFLTELS